MREQIGVIVGMLGCRSAKVEAMPRGAAEALLAFTGFPPARWTEIWSTKPLERLNRR